MSDDKQLTVLDVQIRDMATGAVVYGASGLGLALIALGAPAVVAVCMPMVAYSLVALVRSHRAWRDVKRRQARRIGEQSGRGRS